MDAHDQRPARTSQAEPVEILPTMADLDRLASDLDRVDSTLVEIDGPVELST